MAFTAPTVYQTMSGISDALNEVLLEEVREQITNHVLLLQKFRRSTKRITRVGRSLKALMTIRTKQNESVGNRAFATALPTHSTTGYDQIEVTLGRVFGQISFDRLMLEADLEGLIDVLDEEMGSLVSSFEVDMARQIQLDGSGAMCRITTTGATGTSFVVDDARYLRVGMRIDSYTAKTGGTQKIDSATISDVDYITNTVTLEASATWATNDYVFREDNRGLEANGLLAAVDDGTLVSDFEGQDRSASSLFKAVIQDGGAKPLSEDMIIEFIDTIRKIGGQEADMLISDPDGRRYWAVQMSQERRQVDTVDLKGGFRGLTFVAGGKSLTWFADHYAYPDYIYALRTDRFMFYELGEPKWVDNDGSIFQRVQGVADLFEATLAHYYNLACDRCNCQGRLYNYTDPHAN